MTVFRLNYGFSIIWDAERGDRYFAKILALDTNLSVYNKLDTVRASIPLGDIDTDRTMPSILLTDFPDVEYGRNGPDISSLDPELQLKHTKAIELARYVQYSMYGAVGDRDQLLQQANAIMAQFCRGGNRSNGKSMKKIYDGHGVYSLKRKQNLGRIDIEQASATWQDVELTSPGKRNKALPAIQIIGYSRGRVSSTLEELVTALLDGECNLLQAWESACLKADSVNVTHYRTFMTSCDHVDEERNHHMHVCQGCFTLVFCIDMQVHPCNLRVCGVCVSKVFAADVAGFPTSAQFKSSVQSGYRGRLLIAFRPELENLAERRGIADEQIGKWHDTDGWDDQFISARRPDVIGSSTVTRTSPFLASPDAAPIFHVEDVKTSYHHRKNVVPTAAWANQASHTYLKSVLQVASDFLSQPAEEPAQLNIRMDHLFAIRQQYPWYRNARLDIKMTAEVFDAVREEWRDGIYRRSEKTVYYNIHFVNLKRPNWDPARMRRLTDDILKFAPASEKWPDVEMPRGADGAPFPWRSDHMPYDWSWRHLEACMAYHYNLMWYWCNKDFITDETPASLCFELILQWKMNSGRCAFLDIPLTLLSHHPSEFAIGHKHHKKAMRTAWPNADAITDVRRQMVADRSNVLFESRIANYMKMDYAEEDYAQMQQELKTRCKSETEWFVRPKVDLPSLRFERSYAKALEAASRFLTTKLADDDLNDVRMVLPDEIDDDMEDMSDVEDEDEE